MRDNYPTLVWQSNLPRPEKIVCLGIAYHFTEAGQGCFASYDRLALETGYETRQVIRIVDKLKKDGVLILCGQHPDFGTNIWRIDRQKLPKLPSLAEWQQARKKQSKGAKVVREAEVAASGDPEAQLPARQTEDWRQHPAHNDCLEGYEGDATITAGDDFWLQNHVISVAGDDATTVGQRQSILLTSAISAEMSVISAGLDAIFPDGSDGLGQLDGAMSPSPVVLDAQNAAQMSPEESYIGRSTLIRNLEESGIESLLETQIDSREEIPEKTRVKSLLESREENQRDTRYRRTRQRPGSGQSENLGGAAPPAGADLGFALFNSPPSKQRTSARVIACGVSRKGQKALMVQDAFWDPGDQLRDPGDDRPGARDGKSISVAVPSSGTGPGDDRPSARDGKSISVAVPGSGTGPASARDGKHAAGAGSGTGPDGARDGKSDAGAVSGSGTRPADTRNGKNDAGAVSGYRATLADTRNGVRDAVPVPGSGTRPADTRNGKNDAGAVSGYRATLADTRNGVRDAVPVPGSGTRPADTHNGKSGAGAVSGYRAALADTHNGVRDAVPVPGSGTRPADTHNGKNGAGPSSGTKPAGAHNADKAQELPETDLQRKVAEMCQAKYLAANMKAKLGNTVTASWKKQPAETYPSPEDEWRAHPDWFSQFVDLCARRIREESARSPARSTLVQMIRRYDRPGTGWLDFKAAKERERPAIKERPWYYRPDLPDWMQ